MKGLDPSSLPARPLLPGVAALNLHPTQRLGYPTGASSQDGVYGRLTNGQLISRHLKPSGYEGLSSFAGAMLKDGRLDPALREMIIVRVGYATASAYEVYQHRSLGERLGVTTAELDALACINPEELSAPNQVAIAFVDELLAVNRTSDAMLARLSLHFSEGEIIEIIAVVGLWWTLARMLETAGVPLDQDTIGSRGDFQVAAEGG